jgi:hypothetical protein
MSSRIRERDTHDGALRLHRDRVMLFVAVSALSAVALQPAGDIGSITRRKDALVMDAAIIVVAFVAAATTVYLFPLWIRHQRRLMVHRERLAAIEKGTELPPLEQEIRRGSWNVQRLLLLAGLIWISIGIAAFPLLFAIANRKFWMPWGYTNDGNPYFADIVIPDGTQWIALAPIGIGISHVIVYLGGKQKDAR